MSNDKLFYAADGELEQAYCKEKHQPDGTVLMSGGNPDGKHLCEDQGDGTGIWVVNPNPGTPIAEAIDGAKNNEELKEVLIAAYAKTDPDLMI